MRVLDEVGLLVEEVIRIWVEGVEVLVGSGFERHLGVFNILVYYLHCLHTVFNP